MKRLFKMLLCSALVLCMTGCGSTAPTTESIETTTSQTTTVSESESESETTAATTEETTAKTDTLVIYFSATGTTKGIAEKIAEITGADLYEITAAQPYTDDDRNWKDSKSRCSVEQNDTSVRPEISSETISLDGYKTIYIGYPIWFAQEPRIMDTFVENNDFGNAKVVPFCTSGSSGIGDSWKNLAVNAGSGNWITGTRFSGSETDFELRDWVYSLPRAMTLKINDTEVPVMWEDNDSVKELYSYAASGIRIELSQFDGFERFGHIGKSLTSNEEKITTSYGDIMLANNDQLVVFCGSKTLKYTRLGKILLSEEKMIELLSKDGNVTGTAVIKLM